MARVVLDARAKAHGLEHLEVVRCALLKALRLEELAVFLELAKALAQLVRDGHERLFDARTARHVVRGGPDGHRTVGHDLLARHAIDLRDRLDLVAKELDAQHVVHIWREHVHHIAAHAERAALELVVVAVVLHLDELVDEVVAVHGHVAVEENRHVGVVLRRADAVDAAYTRDDDDVLARQERRSGRMAHFLDFLVDGGILLDVGIGLGDVGFGLAVIVVAHEVVDRIVREELTQLACQLGCQGLVGREHEGGHLHLLDDLRHREGLARSRHAEQRLVAQAVFDALRELLDRLRLIARHVVRGHNVKGVAGLAPPVDEGCLCLVHCATSIPPRRASSCSLPTTRQPRHASRPRCRCCRRRYRRLRRARHRSAGSAGV